MILQALTEYYEVLSERGEIPAAGWSPLKVSYALYIARDGQLQQVVSLKQEERRGKKTVIVPQNMFLPTPVKRSSGIAANFLCDNSTYVLGIDNKGKPERSRDCFKACGKLHHQILKNVDCPAAEAILNFFDTWDPATASEHPALQEYLEDIQSGVNLIFWHEEGYAHKEPEIRKAWQQHYSIPGDGPEMVCLVTGERGPVEPTHPPIKNVAGAQAVGAALVSFNADAFCSYGKKQNINAPVSKYAAFAYTTALNHLLSDRDRVFRVGDTTVVCWAKGGGNAYQDFIACSLLESESTYSSADIAGMVKLLSEGQSVDFEKECLDPNMDFYILGISPNAARLSVRFFLRNTFGGFIKNVAAHNRRMEIERPSFDKFPTLPIWKILSETVNQNARDKSASPALAGEVLRAVLNNTLYPATLLNGITLRIRAEHDITRGRAAILKAYYLAYYEKNINTSIPKEVLTVALNTECKDVPYTLGRLFSILEAIQSAANPGINTTIKDKYFNSASATPALVFPTLINLAQKHMKKLDSGLSTYYDKQVTDLLSNLGTAYPAHLRLPQQGAFQLGYYHQTQKRYEKKEEK